MNEISIIVLLILLGSTYIIWVIAGFIIEIYAIFKKDKVED